MTESDGELSEPWRTALDELELESRPVDPPNDPEHEGLEWFELYSKFATRGFVRAIVGEGADTTALRIEFAIPADGAGRQMLEAVRAEFSEVLGGDWRIVAEKPDWELGGTLDATPETDAARSCVKRLADLGTVAESGAVADAEWLAERVGASSSDGSTGGSASPSETTGRSPTGGVAESGGGVFESIGDGSASSSAALQSVGIDNWELLEVDGSVEARIWLDAPLAPNDADAIGRELTHALRSRYDIAARPLPVDDESAGTELKLRANPASSGLDGPESADQVRDDLESYLERLVRFDELGVKIASVLGIGQDPSADRDSSSSRGKRGRGRREDSSTSRSTETTGESDDGDDDSDASGGRSVSSRRSTSSDRGGHSSERRSRSGGDASSSEPSDGDEERVVLDIGGDSDDELQPPEPTTAPNPESGLKPGNYRDPRLMREDATTSLVDVVLRHPGYAEEKMGHNLSILLDVDYPDAMDLVQQAPSIIAWGVGRDRAVDFKRFIEDAGGKVVLVEPDSLKD